MAMRGFFMIRNKRRLNATPTHLDDELSLKNPAEKAGGWNAILSSQKFIKRDMGLFSGNHALMKMNQKKGFDCPGCAWPDPSGHRSFAEFCENGAKALAEEATSQLIGPEFFKKHSVEELSQWSDFSLGRAGRISCPMVLYKDSSHYKPIEWDQAFAMIAKKVSLFENPNEGVFYTSGRTSNEAAFLYQLFARAIGTNNLPDCSNLCHESSGFALTQSIGIGKGTVTLEDFTRADLILVIGQNPGTNHPRMLSALREARGTGCEIISINPLFEAGLKSFQHPQKMADMLGSSPLLASENFSVKINGDMALFQGLGKAILEDYPNKRDKAFIESKTENFSSYQAAKKRLDWETITSLSGISEAKIRFLGAQMAKAKNIISCWAMGLTQQPQAVGTIRELVNLHLLLGQIGKPGAGLCPVRGHSNVQGDRTMGIYEKPSPQFIDALEDFYGLEFPRQHGYDVVDSIQAMLASKVKLFIGMGGNFVSASPDTERVADALKSTELSVQVSTKLNRSHLITGQEALILPCLARSEKDMFQGHNRFVTVENSMGFVHQSKGVRQPRSDKWLSEVSIVCKMALACCLAKTIPWEAYMSDYDKVREAIAKIIPGFDGFNKKLSSSYGFYLPNPPKDQQAFPTPSGKAQFHVEDVQDIGIAPGHYILMTIRSHDQYNTTIYGLDDRYRGIYSGRRVVFMNPKDMSSRGFMKNQTIHIRSHFRGETRLGKDFKVIPYDIPKGCLASYFPEANVLVPLDSFAPDSQTPTSKFIEVSLESDTVQV